MAILPLLAVNLCGIIPGTLLLRFSLPWVIKTVLGVIVVFLEPGDGHKGISVPIIRPGGNRPWLRPGGVGFSGISAGLFGINLFIVAYLQRTARAWRRFQRGACGACIFRENAVRASDLSSHRPVDRPGAAVRPWRLFPGGVGHGPGSVAGPPAGRGKSSKRGAIVLFLLGGVSIIVKSVVFHT